MYLERNEQDILLITSIAQLLLIIALLHSSTLRSKVFGKKGKKDEDCVLLMTDRHRARFTYGKITWKWTVSKDLCFEFFVESTYRKCTLLNFGFRGVFAHKVDHRVSYRIYTPGKLIGSYPKKNAYEEDEMHERRETQKTVNRKRVLVPATLLILYRVHHNSINLPAQFYNTSGYNSNSLPQQIYPKES